MDDKRSGNGKEQKFRFPPLSDKNRKIADRIAEELVANLNRNVVLDNPPFKYLTPQIAKAINIAATLHDGQERKGDGLPYIVHPFSVALILMGYTEDEDVIVAGILHDTIEDIGYKKEQMKEEFGEHVTELVLDVTEIDKNLPWQKRKDDYLEHLSTACHESKLISAADKLHNARSMLEAFRKFGKAALEKFNAPADKKLWFYEECLKIFKKDEKMPKELIEGIEVVLKVLKSEI